MSGIDPRHVAGHGLAYCWGNDGSSALRIGNVSRSPGLRFSNRRTPTAVVRP